MKLIIVEGPDNTGKSTVVNHLYDLLTEIGGISPTHVKVIHCVKPDGKTNEEKIKYIDEYNQDLIDNLIDASEIDTYDYIILDRSWYSEYVYGQIYRGRTEEECADIITDYQRIMSLQYKNYGDNVWLVMLNADNPDFLVKHEDGKSLSMNTENPRDFMKKEIDMFNDLYDNLVTCNKVRVNVNNKDNTDFKSFDEVYKEVAYGLF